MIKSFLHKGLETYYLTGNKAGIQPQHSKRLRLQLAALGRAAKPEDMDLPGWRLHLLKGNLAGHFSVKVDANWRLTFRFIGHDVELLNYQDYH